MIYSSPEFLALLAFTALGLQIVGASGRKIILLAASYLFVLWAGWTTTVLLLGTVLIIYGCVLLCLWLPRGRHGLIAGAVAVLLIDLAIWKYWPWIARSLGVSDDCLASLVISNGIPAGISFYTFQGIAYLIDFHRGKATAVSFVDFLLFKSFFAQLIAGPIVRSSELMPQVSAVRRANGDDIIAGLELFALGMFKKLVLADRAAAVVDPVFANVAGHSSGMMVCAVLLYTVQIYGDFSGYTDMGRGAARMCGFVLPENFRAPYLSTSIGDFWRRWHITLGRWLRDYVYIPIGGSARGFTRGLANLLFTMALCGLWHGAAWTFVIWGLYHGCLMAIERISTQRLGFTPPACVSIPLTLILVMIGWTLFRAASISDFLLIGKAIAAIPSTGFEIDLRVSISAAVLLSAAIAIQLLELHGDRVVTFYKTRPAMWRGLATACLLLVAIAFRGQEAPFIYFEF